MKKKLAAWATLVAVAAAILLVTQAPGWGRRGTATPLPHDQLEMDRAMTQQMAFMSGPGMDALMGSYGMLKRSSSEDYLRALEEHSRQFDRMLARTP